MGMCVNINVIECVWTVYIYIIWFDSTSLFLVLWQVFEDDWALCAPDSGCPSESMLEDECFINRIMVPQSKASQDHLVLEWDPSVDIGGSISHDGTDSSAFSAAAGRDCPGIQSNGFSKSITCKRGQWWSWHFSWWLINMWIIVIYRVSLRHNPCSCFLTLNLKSHTEMYSFYSFVIWIFPVL